MIKMNEAENSQEEMKSNNHLTFPLQMESKNEYRQVFVRSETIKIDLQQYFN